MPAIAKTDRATSDLVNVDVANLGASKVNGHHLITGRDDENEEARRVGATFEQESSESASELRLPYDLSDERTRYRFTVNLVGEDFDVRREYGIFVITHPKWSLTGAGETMLEAYISLLGRANDIAPRYLNRPLAQMTLDAGDFKNYLYRVVGYAHKKAKESS